MHVTSMEVRRFRNIERAVLTPCEGMNILYGDNAHGKTNLLEGLWLATGGKSFRKAKDSELVGFGQKDAEVKVSFYAAGRGQQATLKVSTRRSATLNGVPLKSASKLMGVFCAVIFSPDHLSLIKDGPEERRRFLDAACCQLRPLFVPCLLQYTRILSQRNALIKAVKKGEAVMDPILMDAFDERLAQSGEEVRRFRREYVETLTPFVASTYDGLSGGREAMTVRYETVGGEGDLYAALKGSRAADLRAGFTTVGPHRDDLEVFIGGNPARAFASQGQQRSAVLSLKLAEATLLANGYGEKPVILLDDVMSELDRSRQEYILNHIEGFQVFITCCEPTAVRQLTEGLVFHMENGQLTG